MTLDNYKVVLYRNQPDGWVAEVPAISGCYALMATREEALAELESVFQIIAADYEDRGKPLPEDTTEILVRQSSGKVAAEALREFWRTHRVTLGKRNWTRDDLYDRRFMRNILLAISISILFLAGARTSKGQTKEERAAKEAPHTATLRNSSVKGPSTGAGHYLLGSFSGSADALGPNFWGNDPQAVITALSLSSANKPKSEFETTVQYEARVSAARTASRQRLAFVFRDTSPVLGPKFSYDADSATMTVNLNLERTPFIEDKGIKVYYTTDLKNVVRSRREYVGTNGFGAKATISETGIDRYGISFAGLKKFRVGDISLSFPISAEQAKDLKPSLRLGIICSVEDGRTLYSADRLQPTISNPYDTIIGKHYLVALPEQLVVFDERTGDALKTVTWVATDH